MTAHLTGPLVDDGRAADRGWFRDLPLHLNPDYLVLFDDFDKVANDQTNDWTVVKDTGASVAIQADTVGGNLLLSSTATTDNDGASIQGNEIFKLAAGRTIWFEARLKVSDADQMDVYVGFVKNFATNPEAVLTDPDRIGFQIDDGNASILAKTEKDGTETSTDTTIDAADDTYVKLGILITGVGEVKFFVNRVLRATHTANIPDDEELTVAVFELSGDATGTKTLALDYILAVMSGAR